MDGTTVNTVSIKDERGTTLIEFSVVLIILLTLTFGMIDFGRYVYAVSVVRAAAQEGASAGIKVDNSGSVNLAGVPTVVKDKMIALDTSRADVVVTQPDAETVEVEVTYQFEFITPFLSAAVSNSPVAINGSASMAIY